MTWGVLIIVCIATAVLLVVIQQGMIPQPFVWIVVGVIIVVWVFILLSAAGLIGSLDQRISDLKILLDNPVALC